MDFNRHQPQWNRPNPQPPRQPREPNKILVWLQNFARKNIYLLREGGWSIQLLRTNFLHSAERVAFWQEYPAKYVYISVRRPSFYKQDPREESFGKANTNAHDYSIFVWQKGWQGETTLRWLDWDYEKE